MYLSQPPIRISVIARPKVRGVGEHWGVLFSDNLVVHNTPGRGEHVSTLQEFTPTGRYRVLRHVLPEHLHATMHRIQEAIQSPLAYHATSNNCQSFANRVTGEAPRSPAVEGAGLLALAGLFLYALAAE
jgi:hypothetical protein